MSETNNLAIPDVLTLLGQEQERMDQEEALKGNQNFVYAEPLSLKFKNTSEFSIVRAVGKFKVVNRCDIIADNKKKFYPIIPSKVEDGGHIIWQAFDLAGTCDWDKGTFDKDGKKTPLHVYKESHPDIYKMVMHNGKEPFFYEGKPIPDKGWWASELLLQNVIDRKPTTSYAKDDKKKEHPLDTFDYCAKEKKTKILSKDGFMIGVANKSWYGEHLALIQKYGVTQENLRISQKNPNLFDNIGYDICIEKGSQPMLPYSLSMADDRIPQQVPFIKQGALTEEELEYEMYDLDKIGKLTSNLQIFKRLGNKLQQVFYGLGRPEIFDEWKLLVDREQKEMTEKQAEAKKQKESSATPEVSTTPQVTPTQTTEPVVTNSITSPNVAVEPVESNTEPVEEVQAQPRKRVAQVDVAQTQDMEKTLDDIIRANFPKMLTADYKHVKDVVDGNIVWKDASNMLECSNEKNCDMITPEDVSTCPKCGTKFF